MTKVSRLMAILLALTMVLTLAACKGKKGEDDADSTIQSTTESESTTANEASTLPANPQPTLGAQELEPGMNYNNDDTTSDYYYPDGVVGSTYAYFQHGGSPCGRTLTFVENGEEIASFWLDETADKHLVPEAGTESNNSFLVDVVLYDNFNFFDYVSGKWYSRGDQNEMNALFATKTFVKDDDSSIKYSFNDNGTAQFVNGDYIIEGEWEVKSPTVLRFTDETGYADVLQIEYNDDNSLKDITSFNSTYIMQ